MSKLVCNIEHKMNAEGTVLQVCKQDPPNPAKYVRMGVHACVECWPAVLDHFVQKHGLMGARAAQIAFRRLK